MSFARALLLATNIEHRRKFHSKNFFPFFFSRIIEILLCIFFRIFFYFIFLLLCRRMRMLFFCAYIRIFVPVFGCSVVCGERCGPPPIYCCSISVHRWHRVCAKTNQTAQHSHTTSIIVILSQRFIWYVIQCQMKRDLHRTLYATIPLSMYLWPSDSNIYTHTGTIRTEVVHEFYLRYISLRSFFFIAHNKCK